MTETSYCTRHFGGRQWRTCLLYKRHWASVTAKNNVFIMIIIRVITYGTMSFLPLQLFLAAAAPLFDTMLQFTSCFPITLMLENFYQDGLNDCRTYPYTAADLQLSEWDLTFSACELLCEFAPKLQVSAEVVRNLRPYSLCFITGRDESQVINILSSFNLSQGEEPYNTALSAAISSS